MFKQWISAFKKKDEIVDLEKQKAEIEEKINSKSIKITKMENS